MSDEVIYSDDCLAEIKVSGVYYPLLCQSEFTYECQQEIILATGPNSGLSREKRTRLSESFATVTGLSSINNGTNVHIFYIIQESIRTQAQTIRLTYTDQGGTSKQIEGTALISNIKIGARIGDFVEASADFAFSGDITMGTVTPPNPTGASLDSDTWIPSGANYVDGLSTGQKDGTQKTLVGKTLIEVDREGAQYDIIANNTTPGNRECSWQTATNRLLFKNDFNLGETVFVIFQ